MPHAREMAARRALLFLPLAIAIVAGNSCLAEGALFSDAECARLRLKVQHDERAGELFRQVQRAADAALLASPHPIRTVSTEGRLEGDRVRQATLEALKDMSALWALGWAYEVTGKKGYAFRAREYVLAWARENRPTGDPIDETSLEPLIVAYDLTRDEFSAGDRTVVDHYLRSLIATELGARQKINNWQSQRDKILVLSAFALRDDALAARFVIDVERQIGANLYADGSSYDFHQRDALHYHIYDLEPLLTVAIAARRHGLDLYDFTGSGGGSIRKSVQFLLPFCMGEEQHREFLHSAVRFDYARADNGQAEYAIGRLFQPITAYNALCLAASFDPATQPAIARLTPLNRNLEASWNLLLSEVAN
jgi:Alginate lyase